MSQKLGCEKIRACILSQSQKLTTSDTLFFANFKKVLTLDNMMGVKKEGLLFGGKINLRD